MKIQIRNFFYALAIFAGVHSAQAQYTYEDTNGAIVITGYTGSGGAVNIPAAINGTNVTSIGDEAFYRCSSLNSVTIPNSVISIGDNADEGGVFGYCTSLTNVTIGNSVNSIGESAFANCHKLTNVTIPISVTNIGESAFYFCTNLTSIFIPDSVTSIGEDAFAVCSSLTNVTIPASVAIMGTVPFLGCSQLTAIIVATSNLVYSSTDGVLFDKNQITLIDFPNGKGGSYTIPASVSSIGYGSFAFCSSLTNVTIPNSVTSIGDVAFYSSGLTSVTIPNSVTSIGIEAFESCKLISITIPASVTNIGSYAFEGCPLTSAFFQGNAPSNDGTAFTSDAIVYYLNGTAGWFSTFCGEPTMLWNPQATSFSMASGHFGFYIAGPAKATMVVEACTNLANPVWLPMSTNILSGSGTSVFSDSQSGNYPGRFYRFRSP